MVKAHRWCSGLKWAVSALRYESSDLSEPGIRLQRHLSGSPVPAKLHAFAGELSVQILRLGALLAVGSGWQRMLKPLADLITKMAKAVRGTNKIKRDGCIDRETSNPSGFKGPSRQRVRGRQ